MTCISFTFFTFAPSYTIPAKQARRPEAAGLFSVKILRILELHREVEDARCAVRVGHIHGIRAGDDVPGVGRTRHTGGHEVARGEVRGNGVVDGRTVGGCDVLYPADAEVHRVVGCREAAPRERHLRPYSARGRRERSECEILRS